MPLSIGTQLGLHEITGLLGKGGIGEVYRARDLKLKREVAIKILPEEFSRDADRVSRFQREAEVLASLNHPNEYRINDLPVSKMAPVQARIGETQIWTIKNETSGRIPSICMASLFRCSTRTVNLYGLWHGGTRSTCPSTKPCSSS